MSPDGSSKTITLCDLPGRTAHIPLDKQVLRKWLRAGYMESGRWNPTEAGTPQGGIISPVLANMALDGLEGELEAHFGLKNTKKSYKTKVNYVRYADDFVITGISKELLENEVQPVVEAFLAKRGLQLAPEKTRVTHISEGFDFLGQNVRKYDDKLLIKPSLKNLRGALTKIRHIIKAHPTLPPGRLIGQLNPVLRGWANYHRHVVAKETFNYVDYRTWKLLWQWCRRRHANRQKRWIKEKYFKTVGERSWVFQGVDGGGAPLSLVYTNDTPIKRHIKIQAEANPYDPSWEEYFEARLENAWKDSLLKRRRIYGLWMEQDKRCLLCHHLITRETGWHMHHIIRRTDGGSDDLSNLVLLHPTCHERLHAAGLSVRKPARS